MIEQRLDPIRYTAQRRCMLCGRLFQRDDQIEVAPLRAVDDRTGLAEGGPWGWGGYTSRHIRSISRRITDLGTGFVLYQRR